MKRCYYISNSYDGAYFVLTDNIDEFAQRMSMYMVNLKRSGKSNHYSFGSVEMSESDYRQSKKNAEGLERDRIRAKSESEAKKKDGPEESNKPPLRLV